MADEASVSEAAMLVKTYDLTSSFAIVPGDPKPDMVLPLAAAITDTIAPKSWEALGGLGTLRIVFRPVGTKAWFLVVRQSQTVHDAIDTALTAIARQPK